MIKDAYCKYIKARPSKKEQTAQLTSSNSVVGSFFDLSIDSKKHKIIIKNEFGFDVAVVDKSDVEDILLCINKGWKMLCMLAYITYCEPKAQHVGIFLFISYPEKDSEAFKNFADSISSKLAEGVRPAISMEAYEYNKIIESNGAWMPAKNTLKPKLPTGTVIVKGKVSFTEKLIEAARNRNIGCYIGTAVFFIVLIIFIIYIITRFF